MFGTRITQVFTSRWKAVTWSLGMLMTAYCSIPSAEETQQAQQDNAPAQAAQVQKSPWAKN